MKSFGFIIFGIGMLFAVVYTAEGFLFKDYNLDEFQVATGYLKDCNAGLYPTDFIWSKPDMVRNLHVCVRKLMYVTDRLTFGFIKEPIDLFLVWLPICFSIFFIGNYLLAFRFTHNCWASLFVACSFMLVRRAIWDWWGIGPTFTMSARGLVLCLLPIIFSAFISCEGNFLQLGGLFFLWGFIANFHPLSGWGFVEFLGITILIKEHFSLLAWRKVVLLGVATMLGSIPFLIVWKQVAVVPEALKPSYSTIKQFWNYYQFIQPSTPKYIIGFLQDISIPLGLAVVGFVLWKKSRQFKNVNITNHIMLFPWIVIGITVFVIIGGSIAKQLGIAVPVMVSEHARNIKMVYLVLPVWIGFAFSFWLQRNNGIVKWGVPILVVLISLVINFPGHKLAKYASYKMGLLPPASVIKLETDLREDAADLEVALWARNHTPQNALFYFDSYEFRYYAQRSLVFCSFDRPCVAFHPIKGVMEEWMIRQNKIQPLKKVGDTQGMLDLAHEYHADFLVVLNKWKPLAQKPVWSNWKISVFAVSNLLQ